MSSSLFRSVLFGVFFVAGQILSGQAGVCGEVTGRCCSRCRASDQHCQLVECTVMVPTMVAETRIQTCVVMRKEEREETYTAFKRVPVQRQFTCKYCYLDTEIKDQAITEQDCHIVCNPVTSTSTVMVPEKQVRPVEQHQKGTADKAGCADEPRSCEVTVLRPEKCTTTCEERDVVFSTTKRDISYCVKVPKWKTEVCTEQTVYKLEPVEKKRTVQVCVPEVVKTPVEVMVCRMVPQTVACCVPCAKECGGECGK
jgi:hypothetical protein